MPDYLKHCPKCRGKVRRVHRHLLDRIISLVKPIHRYRCRNNECGWTGTINDTSKAKKPVGKPLMWVLVMVTAVFMGTCSIKFIEKMAGASSTVSSD